MTNRRHPGARLLTVIAGLVLTAAASVACDPDPADLEAEARAAVERYVAAVAARDLGTATAMTDPRALLEPRALSAPDHRTDEPATDVTTALPDASETIRDPWVSYLTDGYVDLPASGEHADAYVEVIRFRVSYGLGPATGTDEVAVTQHGDHGWTVVDPLLEETKVVADPEHLPAFTFGGVRIATTDDVTVWGYPGAYVAKGMEVAAGHRVEPVTFRLGSNYDRPWDDTSPRLEAVPTDSDDG